MTDKFTTLGKLAWLWMNSPLHRDWDVRLLRSFLLPAIETEQYLLIERDGLPVSYCSWAFLSLEAEVKYMTDSSDIPQADWQCGDRLWFIDWVAPFNRSDSFDMMSRLKQRFPKDVARAIRVKRDSPKARVMEFVGPEADVAGARERLIDYHKSFISSIAEKRPLPKKTPVASPG